jgi:hypothetical protein
MLINKIKPHTITLAVTAAVLYNIWPLGYVLDPGALQNSYISALEVSGKPYAWVFILGDVLTSICVLAAVLTMIKIKPLRWPVLAGYLTFGLATIAEATIPIASRCEVSVSACGISPSQVLSPHDLASIIAAVGLFVGLLFAKRHARSNNLNVGVYKWLPVAFWAWCTTGIFLIASIIIEHFTTLSQALFLLACGIGLIIIPLSLVDVEQ